MSRSRVWHGMRLNLLVQRADGAKHLSLRPASGPARGAAIALVAATAACSLVSLVDFASRAAALFQVAALLIAVAYGSVGCTVAVRRPGNPLGWLLLAIAAVTAFTSAADTLAARQLLDWPLEAWLQQWTFYLVYPVAFSLVLLLFPTGKVPSGRWKWLPAALVVAELPRLVLAAFAAGPVTGHMSGSQILPLNEFALTPFDFLTSNAGGIPEAASWALPALGLAAATVSLVSRWRSSNGMARHEIKWLALVAILAAFAFALHFATIVVFGAVLVDPGGIALVILLSLGIPMAIALALVGYNLYDVDLLLNRTLVYGLLTSALLVLYAVVVIGVAALLQQHLTLLGSLAATAVVAIAFAPLRVRIQRGVDRALFGLQADPYDALSEVSLEISEGEGLRPLLDEVAAAIARSLGVSYCCIVANAKDGSAVAEGSSGKPTVSPRTTSLRYRGQTVGAMNLGPGVQWPRTGSQGRLLADLARQAAVAANAVIQSAELERSRSRLLAARAEERRRLRRDLHDGLGPALAAQTLKAGAARMAILSDLDRADALLREIERDGQATMSEVRRLVHALRPPALDELGLAGALRQVASSLSGPSLHMVLDLPDQLPTLSSEVEAATLRIAQEALANVQRHAEAAECRLSLTIDGDLHLTVEDDGVGPQAARLGVGLASIKERAAELGGFATIGSSSSSGTLVNVRIPLVHGGNT